MEKRFIAAFVLSILILIGWSLISKRLFPPPPVPVQTETPATPEPPAGEAGTTPEAPVAAPPTPASAAAVAAVAEREVRLETELADIILTNKGGRVRSWQLKKFQSAGNAVDFVSAAGRREDALPLSLAFDDRTTLPGINGELFEVTREDGPSGSIRVRFHWSDGAGSEVEKILVFSAREPLVDVSVKATDRGRAVTPRICLGPGLEVEDSKHRSNTYYNGQAVVYDGNQVTRMSRRKIDAPLILPEIPGLQWAGLEDQYFTALVVPGGARGRGDDRSLAPKRAGAGGENSSGGHRDRPRGLGLDSRRTDAVVRGTQELRPSLLARARSGEGRVVFQLQADLRIRQADLPGAPLRA
jgi:YidC/Oxa1 family membrane protein insertase